MIFLPRSPKTLAVIDRVLNRAKAGQQFKREYRVIAQDEAEKREEVMRTQRVAFWRTGEQSQAKGAE